MTDVLKIEIATQIFLELLNNTNAQYSTIDLMARCSSAADMAAQMAQEVIDAVHRNNSKKALP